MATLTKEEFYHSFNLLRRKKRRIEVGGIISIIILIGVFKALIKNALKFQYFNLGEDSIALIGVVFTFFIIPVILSIWYYFSDIYTKFFYLACPTCKNNIYFPELKEAVTSNTCGSCNNQLYVIDQSVNRLNDENSAENSDENFIEEYDPDRMYIKYYQDNRIEIRTVRPIKAKIVFFLIICSYIALFSISIAAEFSLFSTAGLTSPFALLIILLARSMNKKWTINCEGANYQNIKTNRSILWNNVKQIKAYYLRVRLLDCDDKTVLKFPYPIDFEKRETFFEKIEQVSRMQVEE